MVRNHYKILAVIIFFNHIFVIVFKIIILQDIKECFDPCYSICCESVKISDRKGLFCVTVYK